MNGALGSVVTVASMIVGLAGLALWLSPRSNAVNVIEAVSDAFNVNLSTAVNPFGGGFGAGLF